MRLMLKSLADGLLGFMTSPVFTTTCSVVIIASAGLAIEADPRWLECTAAAIVAELAAIFVPWALGYNGVTIMTSQDRAALRRRSFHAQLKSRRQ